jgi:hypothetical protein
LLKAAIGRIVPGLSKTPHQLTNAESADMADLFAKKACSDCADCASEVANKLLLAPQTI